MLLPQERIIERLKEQREREDRERMDEVDSYKKENKDLKEKVNSLQLELTEKEVHLCVCFRALNPDYDDSCVLKNKCLADKPSWTSNRPLTSC